MEDNTDRLQAFCSITFDSEFVIRDLKVIDGQRGLFVAMPSRKLTEKCRSCHGKNEVRAKFCNHCGTRLPQVHVHDSSNKPRAFADIAHPINAKCRKRIQEAVVEALELERIRSQAPDYVCSYDDFDEIYARTAS